MRRSLARVYATERLRRFASLDAVVMDRPLRAAAST
jgi:hypothetical protein